MPTYLFGQQQPEYEPTPEEIREACLFIQREWSPAERRRRSNQRTERQLSRGFTEGRIRQVRSDYPEPKDD
jgi:hypothetical protein